MTNWPFPELKQNHYRIIYADPAWAFSAGPSRNPSKHYRTMKLRDIMELPIKALAHPDGARVFLWVTVPHLRNGFRVLDAWGARYSSARFWAKLWSKEDGMFLYPDSFARGTGYETIGNVEVLLIGKYGRPDKIGNKKPGSLFFGQRREHSRKPGFVREEIANAFRGPRAELFSRTDHAGFDHWGDHVGRFAD